MNSVSADSKDWINACEKLAMKGEPFEVCDVRLGLDNLFFDYLCATYRLSRREEGLSLFFSPIVTA